MEKAALTPSEKKSLVKYFKAALAAGIPAAGIGVAISRMKSAKKRNDMMDPEKSKNVIMVPIDKKSFLSELPTPEQQALESSVGRAQDVQAPSGDISAIKKDILRNRERKFDFFGTKAAENSSDGDGGKDEKPAGESKDEGEKSPLPPRDEKGKFVSPTDPVGVVDAGEMTNEKKGGVISNFLKDTARSASVRPLALSAAAISSMYITAKIVDAVNERRKQNSKDRLDKEREEYVKLMEGGGEKQAQEGFWENGAAVAGGLVIVPAVLAAIVTNRVMENRRKEKKRQSEMSNSYPDEPIVMYKTSEGRDLEIQPETALASILVKSAMIAHHEATGLEKSAFLGFNEASQDEIVNGAIDVLGRPENNGHLLGLTKAYVSGDQKGIDSAISAMKDGMPFKEKFSKWWRTPSGAFDDPGFRESLVSNGKFQDMLIDRFKNDDAFKQYGGELADQYIGRTFKKGSPLFGLVTMLSKMTGYGDRMIESKIRGMGGVGSTQNNQQVATDGSGQQDAPNGITVNPR